MKTIWKFDLTIGDGGDVRELTVPKGAEFVYVGLEPASPSNDALRVWAVIDPNASTEVRKLRIAGTGHPLTGDEKYIGSVVAKPFAWHVFELSASEL